MNSRIQIFAITGSLLVAGLVFELIRKKKLLEQYALLWLFSSLVLFVLSIWRGLLERAANFLGIYYAPTALFIVVIFCGIVLFLHFSIVISKLTEQNKTLAQDLALVKTNIDKTAIQSANCVTSEEKLQSRSITIDINKDEEKNGAQSLAYS
ncbi:MAG: DUF2304 domain-containing protein [Candidatus Hodarchaeota archaeon]